MQCVLHIGTEKTGTTLIQDWLYSNQKELGNQGVYLSDNLGKTNNRLIASYFQHSLDDWTRSNRILTREDKKAYFADFLDRLSKEIREASRSHGLFLITSEHLHSRVTRTADIKALSDFLRIHFDTTKVVCYFRNQFDLAVSLYSTALRTDFNDTLEQFLQEARPENYYYNHLAIANNWSSVFGVENCLFRIYDRKTFSDGDIRTDFLQAIDLGLDCTELDFSDVQANGSLHALQGAAFRAVNRSIPHWNEKTKSTDRINEQLKAALSQVDALKIGKFISPHRTRIEELFAPCNTEFFHRYFRTENRFTSDTSDLPRNALLPLDDVEKILDETLSAAISSMDTKCNLGEDDASYLMNIAIRIANRSEVTWQDSIQLMKLALRTAANNSIAAKKAEEFRALTQAKNPAPRHSVWNQPR